MNYWDLPGFEHLYLEDSWIIGCMATPGAVEFVVEFVLREGHPLHRAPLTGEPYCYRNGRIRFAEVRSLIWSDQMTRAIVDGNDEEDYGSIDSLIAVSDGFEIVGDIGRIQITTSVAPVVSIDVDEATRATSGS